MLLAFPPCCLWVRGATRGLSSRHFEASTRRRATLLSWPDLQLPGCQPQHAADAELSARA